MKVAVELRRKIANFDAQARIVLAQYKSLKGSMSQKVHQLCEMYGIELILDKRVKITRGQYTTLGFSDVNKIYLSSISDMMSLFVFFHEFTHVILQMRNIEYLYIDEIELEFEADNFAANVLCGIYKERQIEIKCICRKKEELRANPHYQKDISKNVLKWHKRFS